jgi:hypothetical protein
LEEKKKHQRSQRRGGKRTEGLCRKAILGQVGWQLMYDGKRKKIGDKESGRHMSESADQ